MVISSVTELATLDLDLLAAVTGGDGYQDYKDRVAKDWQETKDRANQAIKHNPRNGNWNAGKFFDNYAGTLYNGAKTALDAIPVLGPAITNRL